jgi:hypothetical protein
MKELKQGIQNKLFWLGSSRENVKIVERLVTRQ